VDALARMGMKSIRELRGRSDLLCYVDEEPVPAASVPAAPVAAASIPAAPVPAAPVPAAPAPAAKEVSQ
jgi:hypothetical protein